MNEIKKININGTQYSLNVDVVEGYLSSGNFYKVEQTAVDYVEIGGLKWATKNIGATAVTDTGLYFQWGDTQGYTAAQVGSGSGQKYFGWADYKYGNGTSNPGNTGMTKYNSSDGKTTLEASDDAVQAAWGGGWRMPTTAEYAALGASVNTAWTADYEGSGVSGLVLTDKTDSSKVLFFPAAGRCRNGGVNSVGGYGYYWSSSFYSSGVQGAYGFYFSKSSVTWQYNINRFFGFAVRGLWDGEGTPVIPLTVQVTPEQNKLYIDTTTNKIYRYDGSSYVEVSSAPTSLPASDVYNWAKAASKPSYTLDEVSDGSTRKLSDYPKKTIEITWANLKSARDNSQLVPGQWYRITDYLCTTTQENTRAASNQFDILVLATSSNTLSENARAAKHGGNYFGNIDAWQLRYTLDNIKWSKQAGLYATSDNNGYSFKKVGTIELDGDAYILWKGDRRLQNEWGCNCVVSLNSNEGASLYAYYDDEEFSDDEVDTISELNEVTEQGNGTVLWMKDEFDNECLYDFKNIQFKRYKATDAKSRNSINGKYMVADPDNTPKDITGDSSDFIWAYTFSSNASGGAQSDASINSDVHDNVFRNYGDNLPNNVIYGNNNYANSFGCNCYNNTIGNSCYNNSIGNSCYNNTIGNDFLNNTIGNNCNNNTIGNTFFSNTIGNTFFSNTIGNNFLNNIIGNNCNNNTIGNDFLNNTIGNSFLNNTIGNSFLNNTIGNNCNNNTIGNNCNNNTIGNSFDYNSMVNFLGYNSIGDFCNNIRIQKEYVIQIIIENGNQYIDITSNKITSSNSMLRNFTVAQGVNNTTTRKTISHNSVNDTFKTTYQPQNSQVVSV